MAAKKTKKAPTRRTKTVVADPGVAAPEQRELKAFYDGGGQMPDFSYARFYWAGGDGPRESLLPRLAKKRQPVGAEPDGDTAARVEALPTPDAHQEYADPDFLMRRYEETLPQDEVTAFAQVTLRFGPDIVNVPYPGEIARQWRREF